MKTTVRHNLVIFHRPHEWHVLANQLRAEHGQSIMLIRDRCRRELGFTVRYHKGLVKWAGDPDYDAEEEWLESEFRNRWHYEDQVHLDFYNEAQQTFFVLKYLGVNNS